MDPDAAVAATAARQHGLVTREQAFRSGLGNGAIHRRVVAGRWIAIRPRVYAIAGVPPNWDQAVLAAVLAAGDTAAASHSTAARLWDLPCPAIEHLEITTVLERVVRLPGVTAHRSGIIAEADRTTLRGIAVTSGARTAVDLSGRLDADALWRLVDEGLRRGVITLSGLNRCISNLVRIAPGRSPKKLTELLAKRLPGYEPGDSNLETQIYDWIIEAGLHPPVRQHPVRIGGRTYRIDLAYPEQKVAIEVDGFDFHRGRRVFDIDRARGNALVTDGWRLLRFTSSSAHRDVITAVTPFVRSLAPSASERTNKRRSA
jgi:very-short-patch-repair endonuclease